MWDEEEEEEEEVDLDGDDNAPGVRSIMGRGRSVVGEEYEQEEEEEDDEWDIYEPEENDDNWDEKDDGASAEQVERKMRSSSWEAHIQQSQVTKQATSLSTWNRTLTSSACHRPLTLTCNSPLTLRTCHRSLTLRDSVRCRFTFYPDHSTCNRPLTLNFSYRSVSVRTGTNGRRIKTKKSSFFTTPMRKITLWHPRGSRKKKRDSVRGAARRVDSPALALPQPAPPSLK